MHSMAIDPAVNVVFQRMKSQLAEYKEKLEQAQNDLSAWKFSPDRSGLKLLRLISNSSGTINCVTLSLTHLPPLTLAKTPGVM